MKIQFRFSDTGRVWEPRLLCISGALTPRRLLGWAVVLTGLVMLCVVMSGAHAQGVPLSDQSVGIFDNILEQYMKKAVTWEDGLRRIALSLFGGLATISLAWTFIKIMLQKNEATAFIPTMTLQIFTLGFFLYLVEKGTWIARLIITSFTAAGERVGNTDSALTPSWVAINGMDCVFRIVEKAADLGLTEQVSLGLPLLLCGLLLCFAFVGVAILLLVTLIESYFVLYGGVILLGFGALPWTREIPKNYLIYAINVGVKLFVLSLVIGVGVQYSSDWPAMIANSEVGDLLPNVIYLLSGAAVFVAVAWKVPGIAAAISSGALNFNASDVLGSRRYRRGSWGGGHGRPEHARRGGNWCAASSDSRHFVGCATGRLWTRRSVERPGPRWQRSVFGSRRCGEGAGGLCTAIAGRHRWPWATGFEPWNQGREQSAPASPSRCRS